MIDRQDEGSAVGTELLGSSDRLFHWWHKYRDGEMAWGGTDLNLGFFRTLDESGPYPGPNERETLEKRGPPCRLAAPHHREGGRTESWRQFRS